MQQELKKTKKEFLEEIKKGTGDLVEVELRYLGRKGVLRNLLKQLPRLPQKDRAKLGKAINELKAFIGEEIKNKKLQAIHPPKFSKKIWDGKSCKLEARDIDLTLPGKKARRGHLHPLTIIQNEMIEIFHSLNFSVVEGPEVETEWYNFDALNIPKNHPARDLWQTFWLKPENKSQITNHKSQTNSKFQIPNSKFLLRTHTSPVQIRFMETHNPPLRIIVPGRVFRYEASDATHDIQFYQLEGLMVDRNVSVANFKAVITLFFEKLFGSAFGGIRLRPSYFPFTEPSFEVDFYWKKRERWLEIMGAGMVHPNVFRAAGYAPGEWQGFAFGLGIDRVAMMRYKIPDIRLFYGGDLRVIRQF